jgi:hypothetical protein
MHCRTEPRLSQAPPMCLAPEGRTPRTPVPAPPGLLCQGHLRLLGAAPLGTRVGDTRACANATRDARMGHSAEDARPCRRPHCSSVRTRTL